MNNVCAHCQRVFRSEEEVERFGTMTYCSDVCAVLHTRKFMDELMRHVPSGTPEQENPGR